MFVARFLPIQHRYQPILHTPCKPPVPRDSGPLAGGSHKSTNIYPSPTDSNIITWHPPHPRLTPPRRQGPPAARSAPARARSR
jgi:hypothetical protein